MKKLGSQLTTGDVIPFNSAPLPIGALVPPGSRLMVVRSDILGVGERTLIMVDIGTGETGLRRVVLNAEYEVEVRPGTVTTEELDLLVSATSLLISVHDSGDAGTNVMGDMYDPAVALVNRLAPPPAPTMAEVLQALRDVREETEHVSESTRGADAILDRARRAGVFK